MGRQGQVVGTPNRVLYGVTSDGGKQLGFVCDTWLHTADGPTLVVNSRSVDLELPELELERLKLLITAAIVQHYCTRVEVRNLKDEDGVEKRGKVVFFLTDDAAPADILNLVRAALGEEPVELEDDPTGRIVNDAFRDALHDLLFVLSPPGKKSRGKRPA